jgi:hypothetical protein
MTKTWLTPSTGRMSARPAADVSSPRIGEGLGEPGEAVASWLADSLGAEGELDADGEPVQAVRTASKRTATGRICLMTLRTFG